MYICVCNALTDNKSKPPSQAGADVLMTFTPNAAQNPNAGDVPNEC